MSQMRSTIRIAAPPERVFDFVDDWRNARRYLRRLLRWEPIDADHAHEVGAVYRVGIDAGPKRLDGRLRVTDYVRGEKILIRSEDGPRVEGGWTFAPDGEGTRVALTASYDLPGGLAGRVVAAFVNRNAQKDLDASLAELKRLIESS